MPDATHYRWQDLPTEAVNPSALRQYVTGDGLTVARFELARGGLVPRHAHMNEQVSCVLSGALKFRFDEREIVAIAMGEDVVVLGDRAELDQAPPHALPGLERRLGFA